MKRRPEGGLKKPHPPYTCVQEGPVLSVGSKHFFFDLCSNQRGTYLKVKEVSASVCVVAGCVQVMCTSHVGVRALRTHGAARV
jgi:hypothetical protein